MWTRREIQTLYDNYRKLSTRELALMLPEHSERSIRTKLSRLGLRRREQQPWTAAQLQLLKKNYKQKGDAQIAAIIRLRCKIPCNKKRVERKRKKLGLIRTNEQCQHIIKKYSCSNKQFKRMARPLGSINYWQRNDSLVGMIKTLKGWMPLDRYIYARMNGPIPEGKIIKHIDGNTLNCDPDNLAVVDRKDYINDNRNATKSAETRMKKYEVDRIRVMYGLKPKTKIYQAKVARNQQKKSPGPVRHPNANKYIDFNFK